MVFAEILLHFFGNLRHKNQRELLTSYDNSKAKQLRATQAKNLLGRADP